MQAQKSSALQSTGSSNANLLHTQCSGRTSEGGVNRRREGKRMGARSHAAIAAGTPIYLPPRWERWKCTSDAGPARRRGTLRTRSSKNWICLRRVPAPAQRVIASARSASPASRRGGREGEGIAYSLPCQRPKALLYLSSPCLRWPSAVGRALGGQQEKHPAAASSTARRRGALSSPAHIRRASWERALPACATPLVRCAVLGVLCAVRAVRVGASPAVLCYTTGYALDADARG